MLEGFKWEGGGTRAGLALGGPAPCTAGACAAEPRRGGREPVYPDSGGGRGRGGRSRGRVYLGAGARRPRPRPSLAGLVIRGAPLVRARSRRTRCRGRGGAKWGSPPRPVERSVPAQPASAPLHAPPHSALRPADSAPWYLGCEPRRLGALLPAPSSSQSGFALDVVSLSTLRSGANGLHFMGQGCRGE